MAVNTSSRVQTEVHRSICTFFCLPSAPGTSSTLMGSYQTVPEHRAVYLLRECRIMFKKMPGSRSILLERPGRQSWFPRGAVPAPGVMASLVFLLLELCVTCSPTPAPAPDRGPPSVSHRAPTLLLYKSYFAAQQSKIWNKK